jgi:hypothetical protein
VVNIQRGYNYCYATKVHNGLWGKIPPPLRARARARTHTHTHTHICTHTHTHTHILPKQAYYHLLKTSNTPLHLLQDIFIIVKTLRKWTGKALNIHIKWLGFRRTYSGLPYTYYTINKNASGYQRNYLYLQKQIQHCTLSSLNFIHQEM